MGEVGEVEEVEEVMTGECVGACMAVIHFLSNFYDLVWEKGPLPPPPFPKARPARKFKNKSWPLRPHSANKSIYCIDQSQYDREMTSFFLENDSFMQTNMTGKLSHVSWKMTRWPGKMTGK